MFCIFLLSRCRFVFIIKNLTGFQIPDPKKFNFFGISTFIIWIVTVPLFVRYLNFGPLCYSLELFTKVLGLVISLHLIS